MYYLFIMYLLSKTLGLKYRSNFLKFFFKEINTFIQQGHNQLIKSDSKNSNNVNYVELYSRIVFI